MLVRDPLLSFAVQSSSAQHRVAINERWFGFSAFSHRRVPFPFPSLGHSLGRHYSNNTCRVIHSTHGLKCGHKVSGLGAVDFPKPHLSPCVDRGVELCVISADPSPCEFISSRYKSRSFHVTSY